MKKILLIFLLCLAYLSIYAQRTYDTSEIKQLVNFLNQPSGEQGKTNAEAIGITVNVTEANVEEWKKNMGIYTKNEGGVDYIRDISLENKGRFYLGGIFSIENFKRLESLGLYSMGSEVRVSGCPELGEFRLMAEFGKEHCKKRKLEITSCPKLWRFRIGCLVTEYTLYNSNALEQVNISGTDFSNIDFSSQAKLEWLNLNDNAFSEIILPEGNEWRFECKNNRMEPADLIKIIRKLRGDDLYLDWRFPSGEYIPQQIICRDTVNGSDSIPVGAKIDVRVKATFKYGNPEQTYTGTFKWQYKNTNGTMVDIPATETMKQGVYTIPASMANRTVVASYNCEPFFTGDKIQYIINVTPKRKVKPIEDCDKIKEIAKKKREEVEEAIKKIFGSPLEPDYTAPRIDASYLRMGKSVEGNVYHGNTSEGFYLLIKKAIMEEMKYPQIIYKPIERFSFHNEADALPHWLPLIAKKRLDYEIRAIEGSPQIIFEYVSHSLDFGENAIKARRPDESREIFDDPKWICDYYLPEGTQLQNAIYFLRIGRVDFGRITNIVPDTCIVDGKPEIVRLTVYWEEKFANAPATNTSEFHVSRDVDLMENKETKLPVVWVFQKNTQGIWRPISKSFDSEYAQKDGYNKTERTYRSGNGGLLGDDKAYDNPQNNFKRRILGNENGNTYRDGEYYRVKEGVKINPSNAFWSGLTTDFVIQPRPFGKTEFNKDNLEEPCKTYQLEVVPNNNTFGTTSGSGRYQAGEKVLIAAKVIKERVVFENWTKGGTVISKNVKDSITMPANDIKIVGNFIYKDSIQINIDSVRINIDSVRIGRDTIPQYDSIPVPFDSVYLAKPDTTIVRYDSIYVYDPKLVDVQKWKDPNPDFNKEIAEKMIREKMGYPMKIYRYIHSHIESKESLARITPAEFKKRVLSRWIELINQGLLLSKGSPSSERDERPIFKNDSVWNHRAEMQYTIPEEYSRFVIKIPQAKDSSTMYYILIGTVDFGGITNMIYEEKDGIKMCKVYWDETLTNPTPYYLGIPETQLLGNDGKTPLPNNPGIWTFIKFPGEKFLDGRWSGEAEWSYSKGSFDYERADKYRYGDKPREWASGSSGYLGGSYEYFLKPDAKPPYTRNSFESRFKPFLSR